MIYIFTVTHDFNVENRKINHSISDEKWILIFQMNLKISSQKKFAFLEYILIIGLFLWAYKR